MLSSIWLASGKEVQPIDHLLILVAVGASAPTCSQSNCFSVVQPVFFGIDNSFGAAQQRECERKPEGLGEN